MPKLPINNIVSIYQFTRDADVEKYPDEPTYQNVNVCISPIGTDVQTSEGGVASYQLFECFIYDTSVAVRNGDKLVTEDNQEYLVAGKPYNMNVQYLQYVRCLVRQVV